MVKFLVCITVLLMCAGCFNVTTTKNPDGTRTTRRWVENLHQRTAFRERNEVVQSFCRIQAEGISITCIEQVGVSTNVNVSDVYIECAPFILQTYRIENNKIVNCRWSDHFDDSRDFLTDEKYRDACDGHENFRNKQRAMRSAFLGLPNRLGQNDTPSVSLNGGQVVMVTEIGWTLGIPHSPQLGFVQWGFWETRQWTGVPEESPVEIGTFCQAITQAVSSPECGKRYRSFLRAIPLLTDADLERERDTLLIELEKARYHAQYATGRPYVLFPVPERRSPFPAVRGYKPGDKFKVKKGDGYFLIETFKGGE